VNIQGEIAVITGGASGIGRATALALAQHGADIVLADVNDGRLASVSDEIRSAGDRSWRSTATSRATMTLLSLRTERRASSDRLASS
jgi:NAD(P)-dependent dehydrogenase (short-subunit alcohol dehydrogenase family)